MKRTNILVLGEVGPVRELLELRRDIQVVASESLEGALGALLNDIPEVCLYLGGKLLRGCRATKVSANDFAAFDSPNYPALGSVGIDIEIQRMSGLRPDS